jgi:ATP-binding cassette subfamily F protein 3
MAVLSVNGICKSFGATEILRDVSFSVNKNDKVAIIGDNGEGKTTLLKIITKQLEADKGSVYFEDPSSVGYLSQQVIDDIEHTLIEEMELAFSKLKKIEKEMDELIEKIQNELLEYSNTFLNLSIPLFDGKAISIVEASGIIKAKLYLQEEIYYQAYVPNTVISSIKKYIVE